MGINKSMFRAYDVRGVYGRDLTENVMEHIGNAFASGFVKDTAVVGMDGRVSGPSLKKSLIGGLTKAGKNVIDLGVVPRGVCLFWSWKKGKPSAYITASHLTKEWNGVKFAHGNGVEFFEEENYKIRDAVLKGKPVTSNEGSVKSEQGIGAYADYVLSKVGRAGRKLKVVVDCGNGTGGLVAPLLFKKSGFEVRTLFGEVDGNFPNRPSEVDEKYLGALKKAMGGADIGIAYDGDSDRVSIMDERGRMLGPEFTSYLILSELVKKEKGPIVANVECLKIMDEIAGKYGRKIYRIRVGHSFMVHDVNKRGACFGVERSGHFCIPSIFPMDDGIAASLYAAVVLSKSGKKLSEIVDELPDYPFRREKVKCPDEKKFMVVDNLKKKLKKRYEKVNTIDGVRVDFDYGWVLIRASNTEPIIRVSAEADNMKKLNELTKRFLGLLNEEIKAS
ncbi:MAG: phosphomannomutase/phosphoglucomutase [Candidatus Aenigmatarchaeota archaeon]|nr:MAG: phosphomannomutase/phosphoglucomutase [Candidatus Aenigmarchaeota archaeon]